MTMWVEGNRSFFIGSQAFLLDNDHEVASSWATPHVLRNPAHSWVLGRFVEANKANNNKQLFSLDGLQMNRPTITHAPMNMNHSQRRVVGAFVASELVYPIDTAAAGGENGPMGELCPNCHAPMDNADDDTCPQCGQSFPERTPGAATNLQDGYASAAAAAEPGFTNPYIEALGVFWRHYFPDEYDVVEAAHAEGRLFYSMECIPQEIQCAGAEGCGETYEYAGRISSTYCDHLNKSISDKYLIQPHFTAGALLVPPINPGWSRADVHSLVAEHANLAERIHDGVQNEFPHLSASEWEAIMAELLLLTSP